MMWLGLGMVPCDLTLNDVARLGLVLFDLTLNGVARTGISVLFKIQFKITLLFPQIQVA